MRIKFICSSFNYAMNCHFWYLMIVSSQYFLTAYGKIKKDIMNAQSILVSYVMVSASNSIFSFPCLMLLPFASVDVHYFKKIYID